MEGEAQEILNIALALPYLPAEKWSDHATDRGEIIKGGISILRIKVMAIRPINPELCRFLQYIEDYWYNMADVVSVYKRVRKTSNVCETCNRRAKEAIGKRRPLWEMLGNSFTRFVYLLLP